MSGSYLWGFFLYLRNISSGLLLLNSFSKECGPRSCLHWDAHSSLSLHLFFVLAYKQLPAEEYPAPALLGWSEMFACSVPHPAKPWPMGREYACNGKPYSLLQSLCFIKFSAFIGTVIPVFFQLIGQLLPIQSYQNSWMVRAGKNDDGQILIQF